jgi:hypothetical protein
MADETLKVRFIGDNSNLAKASNDAAKSLSQTEKASKNLTTALKTQAQVSSQAITAAQRMSQSAAAAGGAIEKSKANFTGLSRVIQDLPFGFIAISNNLEQLLPAAGGAGLAFSALVSALSFASIGFANWTRGLGIGKQSLEDQVKAIHEARQALDTYVESLDDVTQARVKGLQDAQKELVDLKTLYDATQNQNISLADRKKLVDELQEQYPKYFANIKDETILAGGAKVAYDQLAAAIIATAKARAANALLVDIQQQLFAIEEKQTTNLKDQTKALHELNDAKKGIGLVTGGGTAGAPSIDNREIIHQRELNKAVSEGDKLLKEKNTLNDRANKLAAFAQTVVQKNPEALLDPTGNLSKDSKKDNDDLKKALEEKKKILTEFQKDFETIQVKFPDLSKRLEDFKIDELTDELRDKLNTGLVNIIRPQDIQANKPVALPIKINPILIFQPTDLQKQVQGFARIGELIGNRLGEGFANVFQKIFKDAIEKAILSGLSGDQLEAFKAQFEAIATVATTSIGGISEAFGQLTTALLEGRNGMQAFGESLKNTFVQLAAQLVKTIILAGILSALTGGAGKGGLSFIGAFSKILGGKGFAKGGFVPGSGNGDTVPAMLTPGEFVVPKRFAKMIGGFLGFADGGFVPNVKNINRTSGFVDTSMQTVRVQVDGRVRGKDIVFSQVQTLKSQRRAF